MGNSTDGSDNDVKARAHESLLLRFFVLPPIEKRRMVGGAVKEFCYPQFTKEDDDTYIYYLLISRSFIVTAAFSGYLWASYVFHTAFNFHFFTIYTDPDKLAGSAGWTYSHIVSTTLLLIFLPYAWLLFRANIDFRFCDLLHWNNHLPEEKKKGWPILWRMFVGASVIVIVFYSSSVAINYIVSEYDFTATHLSGAHPSLQKSYRFFLITLAFLAWLYSASLWAVAEACAISYQHLRRLGPRYRCESQSPEQSTNGDFR